MHRTPKELAEAVRSLHGGSAHHITAAPVRETFQGAVVWAGEVHVFDLDGHPEASRCYAWEAETEDGGTRVYAVLGVPPIDSPEAAVRAAIAADHRAGRRP